MCTLRWVVSGARNSFPGHLHWSFTYDQLRDRRISDIHMKKNQLCLLHKTNVIYVTVGLFINISQRTSQSSWNISDTLACAQCTILLFLPHYDFVCDLLLNRTTANWTLRDTPKHDSVRDFKDAKEYKGAKVEQ